MSDIKLPGEEPKTTKKSGLFNNNFFNKLKSIKHLEVYVLLLFAFILLLIFMSNFKSKNQSDDTNQTSFSVESYSEMLEEKLEKTLSNVKGAGCVKCMVMVESGIEYIYATESEEVTNSNTVSGGTTSKTTITDNILTITKNGVKTPVIVKENMPKVTGVIIVASGAGSASVRLELLKAVQALMGVDTNNVEILVGE